MNDILYIIALLLLLCLGTTIYISSIGPYDRNATISNGGVLHCGTRAFSSDSVEEGKRLFKNNCAQCHAKNVNQDLTGPALSGVLRRWNQDTLGLTKYLQNTIQYIKRTKDQRLLELHSKYGFKANPHQFVCTQKDVEELLVYVEYMQ